MASCNVDLPLLLMFMWNNTVCLCVVLIQLQSEFEMYLSEASHLRVMRGDGRWMRMGMQILSGFQVLQSHKIAMADQPDGLCAVDKGRRLVARFNHPVIVDKAIVVSTDLLLPGGCC